MTITLLAIVFMILIVYVVLYYNVSDELDRVNIKLQNQENLNMYLVKEINDAYNQNIMTQSVDEVLMEAKKTIQKKYS